MALVDVPGLAQGHQGAGVGVGLPQPPREPMAEEVRLHLLGEVIHAFLVALEDYKVSLHLSRGPSTRRASAGRS